MNEVTDYTPDQINAMLAAYHAAPDTATANELRALMDGAAADAAPAPTEAPQDTSREALIELCRDGVVPQEKWCNRDSAAAQRQLGEALALLTAGCEYSVSVERDTVWVTVFFRGFAWFEGTGDPDEYNRDALMNDERYYLPTRKRLRDNEGGDWY